MLVLPINSHENKLNFVYVMWQNVAEFEEGFTFIINVTVKMEYILFRFYVISRILNLLV